MSAQAVPNVGTMIYIGVKPLIKFIVPVGCGFTLAKKGLYPLAASKGSGQLILNVLIPSLLFTNVVKSINTGNVRSLGPIILVAALYQLIGAGLAWAVRLTLPVPANFRNGLIVAGMMGNWGDLPFAILATVTVSAPFNPATDPALAQAYACVYAVIYIITMFPLRALALIARDYRTPCAGQMTNPPLTRFLRKRIGVSKANTQSSDIVNGETDESKDMEPVNQTDEASPSATSDITMAENSAYLRTARTPMRGSAFSNLERSTSARSTDSAMFIRDAAREGAAPFSLNNVNNAATPRSVQQQQQADARNVRFAEKAKHPLETTSISMQLKLSMQSILNPNWPIVRQTMAHEGLVTLKAFANAPTISLIIALTVALVNPLKALFISVPDYPFASAPDGKPTLDVIMEITAFLGAAAVPTSLVVLGAALSRIKVPRPMSKLPLKAILALTISRMVLLPIAGIAIVQGLANHSNVIPRSDYVLRFSLLILSCTPSATNQMILTTLVAPSPEENNADVFGCFLLAQYAALFVAMTFVAAYSISLVF